MTTAVVIKQTNSPITYNLKKFKIEELYKKCNFRKKLHFGKRHTWKVENNWVSIFSRNEGNAGTENKYEMPPPIDNELYFGTIILILHSDKTPTDNNVIDFTHNEWNKIYEKLMGGFDDLNGEDSYSEEEDIHKHLQTNDGYEKDGFVVDDIDKSETSGSEESEYESGDESCDEIGDELDEELHDESSNESSDESGDESSGGISGESRDDEDNETLGNVKMDNVKMDNVKMDNVKMDNVKKGTPKKGNPKKGNVKKGNPKKGNVKKGKPGNINIIKSQPKKRNKDNEDTSELSEEEYQ